MSAAADGPDGERAGSSRPCDRQPRLGRWLARAGARTLPGRQAGPSGRYGPAAAACCARRTERRRRRPTAQECTNFSRRVRRRGGGQLAVRAGGPDQRVRDGPVPLCKLRQMQGLPALAPAACRGSAPADEPRYPVPRSARHHCCAACCPRCQSDPAYDAASTSPASPGTVRPPGPSAKITQGARPLR